MQVNEKVVLTVEEAGELLRISRSSAYEAARKGQLPTIKIGRRLLVPVRAIEKMLEREPATTYLKGMCPECREAS
tara:strand:- start:848 stop:1072 length:225 start_codon:yes stop_codon:yes gene_type:complete